MREAIFITLIIIASIFIVGKTFGRDNEMTREQTISNIKSATFILLLPDPEKKGMPRENGTAFFISPDGYIITANHVIEPKKDKDEIILEQHIELGKPPACIQNIEVIKQWPKYDLVLLKADFEKNKNKEFLKGKQGFDYLEVDFSQYSEGEKVYIYGYPLPKEAVVEEKPGMITGHQAFGPRLTSAIISSTIEFTKSVQTDKDTKYYIVDKALHYGNSGGPLILEESGKVIGACVRFQPGYVPQSDGTVVETQSQYSILSSLKNIEDYLKDKLK